VISSPIAVYDQPIALEVLVQPPDGVAGAPLSRAVQVSIRDFEQVCNAFSDLK